MFEVSSDSPAQSTIEAISAHFENFPHDARERLADWWNAQDASPEAISNAWMQRPDRLAELTTDAAADADCQEALAELVLEHSLPLERTWFEPRTREPLTRIGMLPPGNKDDTLVFPPGLAAALAEHVSGRRPSLPILVGRATPDRRKCLFDAYNVKTGGSWLRDTAELIDTMTADDALESILEKLPTEDWLGPTVMVLELGGTCYWREVFGVDADDGDSDDNVVTLMNPEQRNQERELADRLEELGLLFRLETNDQRPWPMIAVPEEMWPAIWERGRDWLAEWLRVSHDDLRGTSARGNPPEHIADFQRIAKWLACEVDSDTVQLEDGRPAQHHADRFDATADPPVKHLWRSVWDLTVESSVISTDADGSASLGRDAESMLNASSREVARGLLYEWCTGYLGERADAGLAAAWGVDETWRREAMELLRARHEYRPVWLDSEGIQQENTGAGCLRSMEQERLELTIHEAELVSSAVWTAKLLWLDLLSLLEPGRWYHETLVADLLRMSTAMSVYTRIGDLMHDPRAYFYLPVQRPSLMNSPMHLDEFDAWAADVLEHLFEPLGLIHLEQAADELSENGVANDGADGQIGRTDARRALWLDESIPVVESPASWPEGERKTMLEFILGEQLDWHEDPTGNGNHLSEVQPVSDQPDADHVNLNADLAHILDRVDGQRIRTCDGDSLWLAPSS